MTTIDKELNEIISKIDDEPIYSEAVFEYCESQEDRKRLLDFIKTGHNDRKEVLLMATQIGIESGNVEGELIDTDDFGTFITTELRNARQD